jgi:hypothetical protein
MDTNYMIYDTAIFDNAAPTAHELFQIGKAGDAVHVLDFTNMRGGGALPQRERFELMVIGVWTDVELAEADINNLWYKQTLTFTLNNEDIIIAPLSAFAMHDAFNGVLAQAAAADKVALGRVGMGWKFDTPIVIGGGIPFSVQIDQQTSMSVASVQVKVGLNGILYKG